MHLLLLDDNPDVGKFVSRAAGGLGWTVETTTEAADFQARLAKRTPDLIMLDLLLSASDGVAQLRSLHARGFTRPIVLISGFDARVLGAAEQLGRALGLSIAGILEKPVRVHDLRALLHRIEQSQAPLSPASVAEAIERQELRIHLQPIVDANTWRTHSLEALSRWRHPARGPVSPSEFIAVAEQDAGVMYRLTLFVIRSAIDLYKSLQAADVAVPIAVNVSGSSLDELRFPDAVADLLLEAGVPGSALQLEVTESVATRDPMAMLEILTRLRLKGIGVAIDDFGTGYSSLQALARLPYTALKIDQSLVGAMLTSPEAQTIVRSVAELGRNMKLMTVAEGVESEAIADLSRDIGVSLLQGHLISEALPPDEVTEWLRAWPERAPKAEGGRRAAAGR